jgi:hypothetical protein
MRRRGARCAVHAKHCDMARSGRGDVRVSLAFLAALGVCLWKLRRSNRAAAALEEHLAARVDRKELTDDEAFDIMVRHRSASAATVAKMTWLFFIFTVAVTAPFMAPFPLNAYWSPWGQLALLICLFAFGMTILNTTFWWIEWRTRRQIEKEAKSDQIG